MWQRAAPQEMRRGRHAYPSHYELRRGPSPWMSLQIDHRGTEIYWPVWHQDSPQAVSRIIWPWSSPLEEEQVVIRLSQKTPERIMIALG